MAACMRAISTPSHCAPSGCRSLAQREQLEALVHQLRAHVAQLAAELHEHQASRSHEAGGAAQAQGGAGVADDNALRCTTVCWRRRQQRLRHVAHAGHACVCCCSGAALCGAGVRARVCGGRKEVARLEDLYETKLQLVQQQADARVEEMQAQARERLQAAEADARAALAQLHEEVQRQVREAEAGMLRQVRHLAATWGACCTFTALRGRPALTHVDAPCDGVRSSSSRTG